MLIRLANGLLLLLIIAAATLQPQSHTNLLMGQSVSQPPIDTSDWQAVSRAEKGVRFRLPRDWRYDNFDLEKTDDLFTIQQIEWNTPSPDLATRKFLRIFTRIHLKGLAWFGHPASPQQMLDNKFESVSRLLQAKVADVSFSDVRKETLGDVEGVLEIMRTSARHKTNPSRVEVRWTGYRVYKGKPQETSFSLGAPLKNEALLRAILSTVKIDRDQ